MSVMRKELISAVKILLFLVLGLIITTKGLARLYENSGIPFTGNVWVNWFGVSFLLYFLYTVLDGFFIHKANAIFKSRVKSYVFWILFICAVYVVFIPFIKGENPF